MGFKHECGEIASQIQPPAFVPNEEKAKAIQESVNKEATKKDGEEEEKKGEEPEEEKKEEEDLDEI